MMKKAAASVASLVALQLVIHLGASGGQVIAADAIASGGADSSSLALYTCAGSALCLLLGAWARERALVRERTRAMPRRARRRADALRPPRTRARLGSRSPRSHVHLVGRGS